MSFSINQIENLITNFPSNSSSDIQYLSPIKMRKLQLELINKHIAYVSDKSVFYENKFKNLDLHINSLNDLARIPTTTKTDLIKYNEQFLASDQSEIVDVCLTSGTSGEKPAMLMQTNSDLARLAYNEEIAFQMTGLSSDDTLLICAALDRAFMAGLAYFLGGVRIKARVVRAGSGSAAQHWQLLKVTEATAIVGVPSLMRKIAEFGIENGEDPKTVGVKRLIAIGEPVRDKFLQLLPLAQKLEEMWGAELYSTYASTELATTYCECADRKGGHLRPELIVTEIVDNNDQLLANGQEGEVVVTPLGVTGMPLVRFKTGDISFIINEQCTCGRTTQRLGPVLGRKNQMLKYKGTTIFPSTILSVLEGISSFEDGYVEVLKNPDGTDRVILHAALRNYEKNTGNIEEELRAKIRVVPEIEIHSKDEIEKIVYQPAKQRKRITFVDSR